MKAWLMALALLMFGAPVQAGVQSVAMSDSGTVIYYGFELRGHHEFGVENSTLYLSSQEDSVFQSTGYRWVPWQLRDPDSTNVSRKATYTMSPIDQLVNDAHEQGAVAAKNGYNGFALLEQVAATYRSSTLVDSVKVANEHELLVYYKGLQVPVHDLVNYDGPTPAQTASLMERLSMRAQQFTKYLNRGYIIIIDYNGECIVPTRRLDAVRQELRDLRIGQPAVVIKDPAIINRFQKQTQSKTLRQIVDEGR